MPLTLNNEPQPHHTLTARSAYSYGRNSLPERPQQALQAQRRGYTVGSTVVLKDEDGEVVFTSYIYVEGDTITLPSTLSGTYTIEVTRGSLTFVGEIEL